MPGEPAVIIVTVEGLIVAGVQTGLRVELFAPALFGSFMSLRRSPEAGALDKFIRVLSSTAFGMWGGWPIALAITTAVPHSLHRYLDIAATMSPNSLQFLVAGLIGYAGFALVDRWLFPVRAATQPGEQ